MTKKLASVGGIVGSALLVAWYLHFLGPSGKATTCIGGDPAKTFFECVKEKMCEKGHLPFSTCHPPRTSN
jgi:hypothetical protein